MRWPSQRILPHRIEHSIRSAMPVHHRGWLGRWRLKVLPLRQPVGAPRRWILRWMQSIKHGNGEISSLLQLRARLVNIVPEERNQKEERTREMMCSSDLVLLFLGQDDNNPMKSGLTRTSSWEIVMPRFNLSFNVKAHVVQLIINAEETKQQVLICWFK